LVRERLHESRTPAEVLWRELESWFREEDGSSHAGPDLTFSDLKPADVERVWQFLRSRADPLDPQRTTWDAVDEAEVSVAAVLERGAVAAASRCASLLVVLDGSTSNGVRLPWLGVFLDPRAVALYWWVSDDAGWNPDTVAALATLIGDLLRLAPAARLELEWGGYEEFRQAIDAYRSAPS
jgi:hypothetical protein